MMVNYPPKHGECKTKSKLLNDMANHCSFWRDMMAPSITTSCHENSHGVSSDLRTGKKDFDIQKGYSTPSYFGKRNGFYIFNDRAILLDEPNLRKSHAAEFIPEKLRFFRFKTYITGQTAWDDTPLYILDEFNAYIAGTECALELATLNDNSPKGTDISAGPIEFLIYTMGLCLAIEKRDPEYFDRQPNFLPFIQLESNRALEASEECQKIFPWTSTPEMLDKWYGPECAEMRKFLGGLTREDFALV